MDGAERKSKAIHICLTVFQASFSADFWLFQNPFLFSMIEMWQRGKMLQWRQLTVPDASHRKSRSHRPSAGRINKISPGSEKQKNFKELSPCENWTAYNWTRNMHAHTHEIKWQKNRVVHHTYLSPLRSPIEWYRKHKTQWFNSWDKPRWQNLD